MDQAHWQHYWESGPCSYPDRTGDLRSVVKIADFYSVRQWHSTGMYTDCTGRRGSSMSSSSACPSRRAGRRARADRPAVLSAGPARTSPNATGPCSP